METSTSTTAAELEMIKLVTGEVVLGELIGINDGITLKKPMTLILDPMQGGIGMMPYDAVYTQEESEEHTYSDNHIMHNMKIHPSFADAYFKQTSNDIPEESIPEEVEAPDLTISKEG